MAPANPLNEVLGILGYQGQDGLVNGADGLDGGAREYLWRDLRDKVGLSAAYFQDGVPLVGFCEESSTSGLRALRYRLWNYGRVPLLINATSDLVSAYSGSDLTTRTDADALISASSIDVTAGLLSAFNRHEIESGEWARTFATRFDRANRVDRVLLRNLQVLRGSVKADDERRDALDSFIGGALTASYLSDRGVLDVDRLDELAGRSHISDIFEGGTSTTRSFFATLAEHFSGDVFGSVPQALDVLDDSMVRAVSSLLRGDDLVTGQLSLWPYDFSVLPGELISTVYEQLLESRRTQDAAYYTPRFIVDLMLDEVLPWQDRPLPRIVDFSCGSGAFLAEAFRRVAFQQTRAQGRHLNFSELQRLLTHCIYGVDVNLAAARVTAFALYLALLDEMDPPTVWASAVLPSLLGKNLIVGDAFDNHALMDEVFDAVVGNPPWASRLSAPANSWLKANNRSVADRQIAEAFVWLAESHLSEGGKLALVLPAKPILHNRSHQSLAFRSEMFANLHVQTIVDLSAIRRGLFADATAPAAIIVADKKDVRASSDPILHVAPHRRLHADSVDALVIVPEEVRLVPRQIGHTRNDVWKTLLWGTERDLELIDHIRGAGPPVGAVAESHGWRTGQGFQIGGGGASDASAMHGLPILTVRDLDERGVKATRLPFFDLPTLHRTRPRDLYRAPLVVIGRTFQAGRISAALLQSDTVFNNSMIGLSAPAADLPLLKVLLATTTSSLGRYWHFLTSSSWGVERDFVELNEHLGLPLAQADAGQLSRIDEILRSPDRMSATVDLDELVFDLFKLTPADRERIRSLLATRLSTFAKGAMTQALDDQTATRYLQTLGSSLSASLPSFEVAAAARRQGSYQAVTVTLRTPDREEEWLPSVVDVPSIIDELAKQNPHTSGIVAQPGGMFLGDNTIYVIKTLDIDRWSTDIALDDADAILTAITSEM
ncbi:HsdM family class I SAM-dependent methyltransferase [Klenkia taihuensis]|uniref:Type I restriction-modification system, DNA methylase subunit n=1 Tax=Klenkia taihuensis TaxID=1225127 RepID=A0A1I1UBG0_9ACTN|nr:N-6 DNA methylase [Klenkia taihuensis]GHE06853.1 type I endonuclease-methyltransferase fusion protein [Klenkia taihuensis]SFD66908.1 Type I restriction-modification system, DNA methylase subunit [Klenkia taihuensis]